MVRHPLVELHPRSMFALGLFALIALANERAPNPTPNVAGEMQKIYSVHGVFVEGCSCPAPCPCELFGQPYRCQSLGVVLISSGMFQERDLSGAKIAYASMPGQWVKIYVDGRDREQKENAAAFAREVLKSRGEVKLVREAKVDLVGRGGNFLGSIDDGRVMLLETEPVLGGDESTPVTHTNTRNPLSPIFCQGKTVQGAYLDGADTIKLAGSNAYFNENMLGTGRF